MSVCSSQPRASLKTFALISTSRTPVRLSYWLELGPLLPKLNRDWPENSHWMISKKFHWQVKMLTQASWGQLLTWQTTAAVTILWWSPTTKCTSQKREKQLQPQLTALQIHSWWIKSSWMSYMAKSQAALPTKCLRTRLRWLSSSQIRTKRLAKTNNTLVCTPAVPVTSRGTPCWWVTLWTTSDLKKTAQRVCCKVSSTIWMASPCVAPTTRADAISWRMRCPMTGNSASRILSSKLWSTQSRRAFTLTTLC